jgi:nitrate/nitrite transporter NarK
VVGRIACGYLFDRLPPARVAFVFTLAPALGCAFLLTQELSFPLAAVAVLLVGLQQGSEVDVIAYFVSRCFGMRQYSSIYGTVAMLGHFGTVGGVVAFGVIFDLTGTYQVALMISVASFILASLSLLSIGAIPRHAEATA